MEHNYNICSLAVQFGMAWTQLSGLERVALDLEYDTPEKVCGLLDGWAAEFSEGDMAVFFGKKFGPLIQETKAVYIADCVSNNGGAIMLDRLYALTDLTASQSAIAGRTIINYEVLVQDPSTQCVYTRLLKFNRALQEVLESDWMYTGRQDHHVPPFVQAMWIGHKDRIFQEIKNDFT